MTSSASQSSIVNGCETTRVPGLIVRIVGRSSVERRAAGTASRPWPSVKSVSKMSPLTSALARDALLSRRCAGERRPCSGSYSMPTGAPNASPRRSRSGRHRRPGRRRRPRVTSPCVSMRSTSFGRRHPDHVLAGLALPRRAGLLRAAAPVEAAALAAATAAAATAARAARPATAVAPAVSAQPAAPTRTAVARVREAPWRPSWPGPRP